MATIYIVATPIGNLEDITLRASRILSEVDIILAEDTRVTRKLLSKLDTEQKTVNWKLISYHHHSGENKKEEILRYLLEGKDIALVTDAGSPGVSDPGNELIDYLYTVTKGSIPASIKIVSIPGPSSLTAAISLCGFNMTNFMFLGFWPKKKVGRLIKLIKQNNLPIIFFDSPHRIMKTLERLEEEFGEDKRVFVARELTKMHEETYRGSISEVRGRMGKSDMRGEVVVVLEK